MNGNGYVIAVYLAYAVVAIGLTVWLARTLSRNGAVFLQDVFKDRPGIAESVNHLLVVGFYMLNLGYAFYILNAERDLDAFAAVQYFVGRLALLLVTLAFIHFVNVAVFWHLRGRAEQRQLPLPVAPQATIVTRQK